MTCKEVVREKDQGRLTVGALDPHPKPVQHRSVVFSRSRDRSELVSCPLLVWRMRMMVGMMMIVGCVQAERR
jgi:hypothetical protein